MSNTKFLGNAGLLAVATLLSRVLALIRDMAMAWLLGAGPVADCLVAALRIPHAVRRLLGEGSLSMTLTAWLAQLSSSRLRAASRMLHVRVTVGLGCVLAILLYASPWLANVLLPGFAESQLELAVTLLRLALPYVFWAGLAALSMALLHGMGIFGPSALSPVAFNLTILVFTLAAALLPLPVAHTLAMGMTCGGLVQWFIQWRAMRNLLGSKNTVTPGSGHISFPVEPVPQLTLVQLPAGLVGAAAPQLVLLAAMGLASGEQGMVTALYYAERILELPLGLVGICLGMASLPVLSRHVAEDDFVSFLTTLRIALRWAVWLSLAACTGLWAVGNLLVTLLFGHGNFTSQAVMDTWLALAFYAPAIPACAVGRNLLVACNALGQTRLTAWSALAALAITLATGLLGLPPAAAACVGLWVQPLYLWTGLRRQLRQRGLLACDLLANHARIWQALLAAAAAGLAACWVQDAALEKGTLALFKAIAAGGFVWAFVLLCMRKA